MWASRAHRYAADVSIPSLYTHIAASPPPRHNIGMAKPVAPAASGPMRDECMREEHPKSYIIAICTLSAPRRNIERTVVAVPSQTRAGCHRPRGSCCPLLDVGHYTRRHPHCHEEVRNGLERCPPADRTLCPRPDTTFVFLRGAVSAGLPVLGGCLRRGFVLCHLKG